MIDQEGRQREERVKVDIEVGDKEGGGSAKQEVGREKCDVKKVGVLVSEGWVGGRDVDGYIAGRESYPTRFIIIIDSI